MKGLEQVLALSSCTPNVYPHKPTIEYISYVYHIEDVSQTLIKTHKILPVYIFLITYY